MTSVPNHDWSRSAGPSGILSSPQDVDQSEEPTLVEPYMTMAELVAAGEPGPEPALGERRARAQGLRLTGGSGAAIS